MTAAPHPVLVVDDHPVFRRGLRDVLESTGRYRVVGEVATGAAAVQQAAETEPALVVLDLRLPDTTGDIVCARLLAASATVRVLVVTLHAEPSLARRCLEAGALGVISKESDPDDLLRAADAVTAGQQILGPGLADRSRPVASPLDSLTPRELEVADGLSRGLSNPEIAAELHLSPKTVRNLVSQVLMRLGVDDRVSAALIFDRERRTRDASRDD